jgi:hypothetical protein
MASIGRRTLNQTKSTLASKFDGRVTIPLADVLQRVIQLQAQVAELTRIVTAQADVGVQTTELLGRLIATSSDRLDVVEDWLRLLSSGELPATKSTGSRKNPPRAKAAGTSSASGDSSQH